MSGQYELAHVVPPVTAVQSLEINELTAKSQLDYLIKSRAVLAKTRDFIGEDPEAVAAYLEINQRINNINTLDAFRLTQPLPGEKAKANWALSLWSAMLDINPAVASKSDFTFEQRQNDADFKAISYVQWGLTLKANQCDVLLTGI